MLARGEAALADTVRELRDAGCAAAWVSADLGDRTGLERAARAAAEKFGEPDILVNSAGINLRPPMNDLTAADWDLTMAVNLTAPFLLGQLLGPRMAARGWGRIINVASQQAARAFANSGAYGASKGGLVSLTRSQSEAWAPSGVRSNAVSPGFVATPLTSQTVRDPAPAAALAARTMIGRNGAGRRLRGHRGIPRQPGQRVRDRPGDLRRRRILRQLTTARRRPPADNSAAQTAS